MRTHYLAIVLALVVPACGKKKPKPLGDKKTACDNIYKSYRSSQDPKVWADACMAAPDENVRCVNLIMEEGKDDACKKLVNSPERTKLVLVLNGKPEPTAPTPDTPTTPDAPATPEGSTAAAPPAGKMAAIRSGSDSMYDGENALYLKYADTREVVIPGNCDKFTCDLVGKDGIDNDKLYKACPDAIHMNVKFDVGDPVVEPKVGPAKVRIYVGSPMSGGDLTGDYRDGATITEFTADSVKGTIDLKDGADEAHGSFAAKVCK